MRIMDLTKGITNLTKLYLSILWDMSTQNLLALKKYEAVLEEDKGRRPRIFFGDASGDSRPRQDAFTKFNKSSSGSNSHASRQSKA